MSARWLVQRAGAPGGDGYLRGWLAIDCNGNGYYLPTWREAIDRATAEADEAFARDLRAAAASATEQLLAAGVAANLIRLDEISNRMLARLTSREVIPADHRTKAHA